MNETQPCRVFLTGASGFIGTHFVNAFEKEGTTICNYDATSPLTDVHREHWIEGDIMDAAALEKALLDFAPNWVIHLAARTDCDEKTTVEKGYQVNTTGTANLLAAVKACECVERLIVTSSQYVCGPGRQPESDDDYFPHTVYGHSKVETERLTRAAELPCIWTLIRPVNIWGAYHARYGKEFWKVAAAGLYFHPDVPAPTRTYGYVGNVVWQVLGLLNADAEKVHGEVFYVGDQPIQIDRWSIGFCKALRGKEPPRIPMWAIGGLAKGGDVISKIIRRPFLITSSRLKSMTVDYFSPIDKTEDLLGSAPYSLEEGIEETASWYLETKGKRALKRKTDKNGS